MYYYFQQTLQYSACMYIPRDAPLVLHLPTSLRPINAYHCTLMLELYLPDRLLQVQ